MSFEESIVEALGELEAAGLLRRPRRVSSAQGPIVDLDGRAVVSLCSNNYLGLADDPRLVDAAMRALATEGLGAGASRLISGTMRSHVVAEERLARFVATERALLFSTGYAANVGTLQALAGPGDVVFSDELNHASLIDGCRLSRAEVHVYRHADVDHLRALFAQHRARARRALVATDALFSMDGDAAPIAALREICDAYDAALVVDEAHALGVVGPRGTGACAGAGVRPDVLVGTLGKAFGVSGAFVAASAAIVALIENRARSYVFSTAMPPALAAAIACATDLVEQADDRRATLLRHAARLRAGLRDLGYDVLDGTSPIVPLLVGDPTATMRLSAVLLQRGVFAHGIRPPTVPEGTSRIRMTTMATHADAHIDLALEAFAAIAAEAA